MGRTKPTSNSKAGIKKKKSRNHYVLISGSEKATLIQD